MGAFFSTDNKSADNGLRAEIILNYMPKPADRDPNRHNYNKSWDKILKLYENPDQNTDSGVFKMLFEERDNFVFSYLNIRAPPNVPFVPSESSKERLVNIINTYRSRTAGTLKVLRIKWLYLEFDFVKDPVKQAHDKEVFKKMLFELCKLVNIRFDSILWQEKNGIDPRKDNYRIEFKEELKKLDL